VAAVVRSVRQVGLAAVVTSSVAVVPVADAAVAIEEAVAVLSAGRDRVCRGARRAADVAAARGGGVNRYATDSGAGLVPGWAVLILQAVEIDDQLAGADQQRQGRDHGQGPEAGSRRSNGSHQ